MNYLIETIGCQMNVCDSDMLVSIFSAYGASKANNLSEADVVILNTCSVRSQAEQKAFSYLGRVKEFKQKNPCIKIVVIGCMAERLGPNIKKRFSSVDLIIGAKDIGNAALKIMSLFRTDYSAKKVKSEIKSKIVRYITIMRGCDNYCSYCAVPFVRGREVSINCETIVNECSSMVKNGAREIILLGQNVNSYQYEDVNFASLIKKTAAIENLERIRFMTNHPKDLSDDLIKIMATEPKVCPHIHIPMQSASDKILKAMNRKYSYEHYLGLIKKLRTAVPDVSVTTDIIVGFPGETDEDFEDTLKAVKTIRFGGLYVFRYSPRPDTKAAEMIDDVPFEEKKRRHAVILKESNKISIEIVSEMLGSTQQVLAEEIKNGIIKARTKNGRKVFAEGRKEYIGKHINVNIKEAKINSLFGDIV
ncbi:tRNA-2-methylthio-N(6)-dimethylallyladenosine synthase [Endomicrobiia bacterium]|nr:tRNA-2-methylthio-N(6)-dimethylallyladenosine synthase [Endomicrobiia bacterium]GHT10830.1 tRNA-2-methylthio-N(6)-dimethylallyladenosine synthase [Endomicrobiia bacterium]GHT20757.1 tRNA-2-methylthio-N(6)-dimethylallyladenosine synthase [Endomicrobiia bacterium]GHT25946.1 tRNA-2-methylthio-N(6)-dimethylallyladenosine synthase [Endomicrobiia bacterium]